MDKQTYDVVYPDPLPEGVRLEKNVYAAMRDGVRIAVDIYRPAAGEGPWPAIFAPLSKSRISRASPISQ